MTKEVSFRNLLEKVTAEEEIYQVKLPVSKDKLSPVISKDAMSLHYDNLYKNYVEKSLAGEGKFYVAGAKLHTLFFEQMQSPKSPNNPDGAIKAIIDKKFGSFSDFKSAMSEKALGIHGSGWVYLDTKGAIKTIANHEVVGDVALIIDMWEHSFIIDYGADKKKYLSEMWKIIDWSIINARINQNV